MCWLRDERELAHGGPFHTYRFHILEAQPSPLSRQRIELLPDQDVIMPYTRTLRFDLAARGEEGWLSEHYRMAGLLAAILQLAVHCEKEDSVAQLAW